MNDTDQQFLHEVDERFTDRQWYHQRFDGAPIFMAMIAEAELRREPRKPAGTEARWRICFFEQGKGDWFLDEADIARGADVVVHEAANTEHYSKKLMAQWQPDEAAFQQFFDEMLITDLTKLSDEELVDLFEEYRQKATNRFTSSASIDHFALGTDRDLADKLKAELEVVDGAEFHKLFSIATAPVHQSFIVQAEVDLLAIVQQAQSVGIDNPAVQMALKQYQARYFWLNNNYVRSQVISLDEFTAQVQRWLDSGKDIAHEIVQLKETPAKHRAAKAALFTDHQLSAGLHSLIEISEDFTWWQDERKRATYLSSHVGSLLLTEMGSRRGVDVELLKYLGPSEVRSWFINGAIAVETLSARQQGCIGVWEEDRETILHGLVVAEAHRRILGEAEAGTVQDIRGLVANTGRAIGTAKVVMSSEDIGKVEDGDILVAVMTRPDYVPAMRKAAAIVTDEGGITSHTAIVSRELGVPCIIGTKIATKSFIDGDTLEVNANHNWVRKVEL